MNRDRGTREFKAGIEEQALWLIADSSEYFNWNEAQARSSRNPKPSMTTLSLRLPVLLLDGIKAEANKRGMPYQALIQTWLAEAIEQNRPIVDNFR